MSSGVLPVTGRLDRLRPLLDEAGADALLVTELANVRYLTGFTGSAGVLLVTGEEAVLATDGRYRTQGAEQLAAAGAAPQVELVVGGVAAQRDALAAVVGRGGVQRLALEAEHISWAAQRRWSEALRGIEPVASSGLVEMLRLVKDEAELERMARAAAVADAALAEVLPMLGERRTETEVALALDTAMRRLGADDRAFETIVASGPNAAKPHARPGPRRIEVGDPVVIDFGATCDGYRSDMTRTFCVGGEPSGELARLFALVTEAQRLGVAAVAPGVVSGDVDRVCREHIAEAGYGEAFEHGTGHGVGLHIHEAPAVGPGATAILANGVVVTVEPGIYVAGVGGVRVEDTVVVTTEGRRALTRFPKDIAA
ncbi:MAG TPA: Xaa-Pro peptidase family protein [Acidimicrobiales bacterium]|nr:Xaa-Pro peptidase family protein [Acidimicrobiales bacterium]